MDIISQSSVTNVIMVMLLVPLFIVAFIFVLVTLSNRQHFSKVTPIANAITQVHAGLRCAKCDGKMEAGFIIDRVRSMSEMSTWIPGAPTANRFGNLKETNAEPVVTFRCAKCGYAESYTK